MVDVAGWYLGGGGRVGFVEESPHFGLEALPGCEGARMESLLVAEHPCHLFIARPLRVQIQLVQNGQSGLEHSQQVSFGDVVNLASFDSEWELR